MLIIFDCDGVLVDSEIIANRILAKMLTQHGYPISTEECIKKFTGISDKEMRLYIQEKSGITLPKKFLELMQNATVKAFETELKPIMLPILDDPIIKNINKCVASSSPRYRVLRSLLLTKQQDFFINIFTGEQVQKSKPAPDLFLFAAIQMGFEPKNCLVIEDSIAGIIAAQAAQMNVIGFVGGRHAQYDWYKERIKPFNVPLTHNTDELLAIIKMFINQV